MSHVQAARRAAFAGLFRPLMPEIHDAVIRRQVERRIRRKKRRA